MMSYLNIGSSPCNESCAQVGADDYSERGRVECKAFINQIERHYPAPEGVNAYPVCKGFPHDFGIYHEVCIKYDDDLESANYAFLVERDPLGALADWDEQAIIELGKYAPQHA